MIGSSTWHDPHMMNAIIEEVTSHTSAHARDMAAYAAQIGIQSRYINQQTMLHQVRLLEEDNHLV